MHIELSRVEMRLRGRDKPLFTLPSLDIAPGSRVLIHGPSGSGKTTLLHLLCGQFLPHAGSIRVGETDLTTLSASDRARYRREHFGIIFQRANLIEHLTSLENIEVGMRIGFADFSKRAMSALQSMGLDSLSERRAGLLSPGEQQRVAVARICATSPSIILADEPTSSLDLPSTDTVMDALWKASHGKTLVTVSHDPRILSRFDVVYDFTDLVTAL